MRITLADRYKLIPESWFQCGIREYVNPKTGETMEEYYVLVRLPSYGMDYSFAHDEYLWSRRTLLWLGNHGFRMISTPI